MREDRNRVCYELLMQVFRDGAYASIALNSALSHCDESDKPYITKLFYGVLERSVYYDYVLSCFAAEKPKKPVAVLVKMGYYLLERMSEPAYAVVNNIVALCKKVGKGGAAGFVNSALRNFSSPALPQTGTVRYLSVRYSCPEWLCECLVREYGYDFTERLLGYESDHRTHIRVDTTRISPEAFAEKYGDADIEPSPVGYYVTCDFLGRADPHDYVIQSASSVAAVHAYLYNLPAPQTVLDVCAAPGGKAVLAAELTGAHVTACDIHAHRTQLVEKYARRCGVSLSVEQNDATVFRPEWENTFDLVICDVPCSGIGVIGSKPDILFNRSPQDIEELAALQRKILQTASRYVKTGGRLCYSTCTILQEENDGAVCAFEQENEAFVRAKIRSPFDDGDRDAVRLYPHIHRTDGFYVAAFTKQK